MISIKNGVITVREMTEEERERENERMWSKARHDEAQALKHAREQGEKCAIKKLIAENNALIKEIKAENERLRKLLAEYKVKLI